MSKGKLLLIFLLTLVFITGCSGKGSLNEGDCVCTVTLTNIPEELSMSDNHMLDEFVIDVELINIRTEKLYTMKLNAENQFSTEIYLNPGTYKVENTNHSLRNILDIDISTDKLSVELSKNKEVSFDIFIKNEKELNKVIKRQEPLEKILKADLFSRKVQIDGKIFSLDSILKKITFDDENIIGAYEKGQLTNSKYGIKVNVLNTTDQDQKAFDCKLIDIIFKKALVVFPKGVSFGMSLSDVCNEKNGRYGIPTTIIGSPYRLYDIPLLQENLTNMSAVYNDTISGDQMTITFSTSNALIDSIKYEFEKYE